MKNIFLLALFSLSVHTHAQIITTIAGIGTEAYSGDGGPAIDAGLDGPFSIALDGKGNFYIADGYNNRIRKVDAAGIITTIAGSDSVGYNGDGIPATAAWLYHPVGITFDHSGNLYFTDAWNERVRKIDTSGIITTIAGNGFFGYNGDNISADSAELYEPWGIAVDAAGNIYISDGENHRVRKINTAGIITTIAGTGAIGFAGNNGPATAAEINNPYGIALDDTGNIYFADASENFVRKISTSGIITIFAGGGPGPTIGDGGPADSAVLVGPAGLTIDSSGNLYIADVYDYHIRKVFASTGIIISVAGDGLNGYTGDNGPATAAGISDPAGVTVDPSGNLYIADFGNQRIRYVTSTLLVKQVNNTTEIIHIYPNPSQGVFTVIISSNIQEPVEVTIVNVLGEKIKELTTTTNTNTQIQLDVPMGIYYISAISKHGKWNGEIAILS